VSDPKKKEDLSGDIARLRATVAMLEALALVQPGERMGLVIGVIGVIEPSLQDTIMGMLDKRRPM
jgi:hypothetical protein